MTFFVTLDGVQGAILIYDLRIVLSFDHRVCFLMSVLGKLPFSHKSDCKKEKSVASFTHEQNIICSQIQLDDIAY